MNISLKKPGSKLEHQGIKIEFIGQIEMYYDRGNHHEFISLVKELARPGDMIAHTSYPFEFSCVEKPFEVYTGETDAFQRYFTILVKVEGLKFVSFEFRFYLKSITFANSKFLII